MGFCDQKVGIPIVVLDGASLEKASREYCRLMGFNPDEDAEDPDCMALCYMPRWRLMPKELVKAYCMPWMF